MKITYRREMKHNYLIVDPESLACRNYQCRMLAANSIEGVLHFQIRQVDDEIRFYYEITSKQPLDRMLESRSVHEEELRSLVFGIARVLDRMEQYLLPEGSVLLKPDYIYVEPETFRVWLCLVPGLERNFPEDYGKLLEYLLGKVDHQDKDSVVLAYGLYQETRKENYGMDDILRLFGGEKGEEAQASASDETAPKQELLFTDDAGREKEFAEIKPNRRSSQRRNSQDESRRSGRTGGTWNGGSIENGGSTESGGKGKRHGTDREKEKTGLWNRLKEWWSHKWEEKGDGTVQVPWEMMFHEEDINGVEGVADPQALNPMIQRSGHNKMKQTERLKGQSESWGQLGEPILMEKMGQSGESRQPTQPGQDTVLLADLGAEPQTKLRCLRTLDQEGEDIVISYYPFIIGKQENLVDYLLQHDTVSRLHLRIDREESRYFVQDLNSTNGTTVDGRLLDNNESVEIHEGDEIHIARYRYRFE